jgi:hypothetical protein
VSSLCTSPAEAGHVVQQTIKNVHGDHRVPRRTFDTASFFSLNNDEESSEGISDFILYADLFSLMVLLSDRCSKVSADYVL